MKNRSRPRQNRNRGFGNANIMNRVFDSSGPDGKVRGTPQQIIDKYKQLAHDAKLSNDPVAMENFHQHAEYYARMIPNVQRDNGKDKPETPPNDNRDARASDNRNDDDKENGAISTDPAMDKHDDSEKHSPATC